MLGWPNCLCNFIIVFFWHSLDVSTQASTGIISVDEVSGIFKNFPPCVLPTGMDVPSTSIVPFIVLTVIPILPISVSEISRGILASTMSVLSRVVLPPNLTGRVIDPRDLLGQPLRNLSWPFVVTREISFSVIPSCSANWLNQDKPKTVLTQHVSRRPQLVSSAAIPPWIDRRQTNKHTLLTQRTNLPPHMKNPTWLPPATNQKALFQLHHGKFICWNAYWFLNKQSMLNISLPPVYPGWILQVRASKLILYAGNISSSY